MTKKHFYLFLNNILKLKYIMKTLLVKLQFKLASWLYDQGIIAPQLMECDSMVVLPSDYSDEDLEFYRKKQSEIKFKKHGNIND